MDRLRGDYHDPPAADRRCYRGCLWFKVDYFTLIGVMAGATTDPPALAYSNDLAGNDIPSVGYATVYPLTMFLRVLSAQLLILFLA